MTNSGRLTRQPLAQARSPRLGKAWIFCATRPRSASRLADDNPASPATVGSKFHLTDRFRRWPSRQACPAHSDPKNRRRGSLGALRQLQQRSPSLLVDSFHPPRRSRGRPRPNYRRNSRTRRNLPGVDRSQPGRSSPCRQTHASHARTRVSRSYGDRSAVARYRPAEVYQNRTLQLAVAVAKETEKVRSSGQGESDHVVTLLGAKFSVPARGDH